MKLKGVFAKTEFRKIKFGAMPIGFIVVINNR